MSTYLGVDFGEKRMGIAVGQTITRTATPLTIVRATAGVPHWTQLDEVVNTWQPDGFVVGLPFNMDDTEAPITAKAKAFADSLQQHYQKPVHLCDERLTTKLARLIQQTETKASKRNAPVDAISAQLILEGWLQGTA